MNIKKINIKFTIESILIFLFSIFILLDMINGYLLRNGFFSISLILKSLTFLLTIIYLITFKKSLNKIIYVIGIIIFYLFVHLFITSNIIMTLKGLDWLIKFLSVVVFYIFFSKLIVENKVDKIFKIVTYSFVFLCINFIIGFLGYGYPMYEGGGVSMGTRGFIFAGNEISVAIIVSGAILQMYFLEQRKYLKFLLISILMLSMGGLLTAKVAILASILITLGFTLIKASEKLKHLKINIIDFKFSLIILVLLPIISFIFIYYALFVSGLINRFSYFYNKLDIITFLLSKRNIWAIEAIHSFYDKYSIFNVFFGASKNWFQFISGNKMVEIDILDFLMTYGIVGVVLSYGFLFLLLFKNYLNKLNPYKRYISFTIILLIGISCTSGHVLASGTAGFLIACLLSLVNYKRRKN